MTKNVPDTIVSALIGPVYCKFLDFTDLLVGPFATVEWNKGRQKGKQRELPKSSHCPPGFVKS